MTGRPMPDHGTRARYVRNCRCDACFAANGRYCKEYRTQVHRTGRGRRVDAGPVIARIRHWQACGYSHTQIAAAAGVSRRVIDSYAKAESSKINPASACKILTARLSANNIPAYQPIDATGTVRRLRALQVLGHRLKDVAQATDHAPAVLSKILNGHMGRVRKSTASSIADLYEEWRHLPGTCARTRARAEREGWYGPAAWDDIDDPTEEALEPGRPIGKQERAAQRAAEVVHLARSRVSFAEIAERLGLRPGYVRDHIREHHPRLFLELTA